MINQIMLIAFKAINTFWR